MLSHSVTEGQRTSDFDILWLSLSCISLHPYHPMESLTFYIQWFLQSIVVFILIAYWSNFSQTSNDPQFYSYLSNDKTCQMCLYYIMNISKVDSNSRLPHYTIWEELLSLIDNSAWYWSPQCWRGFWIEYTHRSVDTTGNRVLILWFRDILDDKLLMK